MSYNGSGTFVVNSSGQPVVTGTVISSTAFNALTADLATGLSTAITKDGQTTTTSRILFAQGISSTLVTDATSATTGSIITAGGISTQKALWVGTTSQLVGAVSSSAGISNGTAGQIANSISQNSLTSFQVTNSNAGAAAQASYRLYNGNTIADLSVFGTAFTADGVRVANGVALDARPGGAADLALLGTTIRFATSGTTEIARFNTSGFTVGTGTTPALITLNGQSGVGPTTKGWAILPQVAGVAAGIIGSENYVFGSGDTNLVIQAATGKNVKIFSNAGGTGVTVNSAGTVTMGAYGAGAATFDASGNITSTSDLAQKIIIGDYTDGLDAVVALSNNGFMGWHKWRPESGMETEGAYASFFARDDFPITGAVHKNGERPNSFSDRPVLMAVINAIAELTTRLAALENK